MPDSPDSSCVLALELTENPWNRQASSTAKGARAQQDFIATVAANITESGGEVVRSETGAILAAFAEADAGFHFGQRALGNALQGNIDLRAGLHLAATDSSTEEGDFDQLSGGAAEICRLAAPGELLLTGEVYSQLSVPLQQQSVRIDKGAECTTQLYVYNMLEGDETIFPHDEAALDASSAEDRIMFIAYAEREYQLGLSSEAVTIGRSTDNAIVVTDGGCSRRHAVIESENGSFVLRDQSTNGTYLLDSAGECHHLQREAKILTGSGRICFGSRAGLGGPEALAYRVQEQPYRG